MCFEVLLDSFLLRPASRLCVLYVPATPPDVRRGYGPPSR